MWRDRKETAICDQLERRERHRRSQALNQRYGGGTRQGPNDNPRDTRNRDTAPPPAPAKPVVEEKKVIDHTAIPDPHMFDNLKRETDDIAALTVKKLGGKRQIFSNWAKYEMPSEQVEEEQQSIGADYETLLQSAQIGAQFQLRSERSWDPKSLPTQSAAFTIDLGVLATSLACLPLYEKLQLPLDVFTMDELEDMERQAKLGRETWKHKTGKGAKKEGLAIYGSLLEKLTDMTSEKISSELPSFAANSLANSDARRSVERTPEREQTPDQDGKETFDFGVIPTRSSSESSSASFRKERSVGPPTAVPLREVSPKAEESLPKQQAPAAMEVHKETTPEPQPQPQPEVVPADVEEPHVQLPQLMPAEEYPPPVLPELKTEQKEPASEVPKEVHGRKKSRGGRNKGNKRRSWGQEGEEAACAELPAASQAQPPVHVPQAEVKRQLPTDHHIIPSIASHEIPKDHQPYATEERPTLTPEVARQQLDSPKPSAAVSVNKEKPRHDNQLRDSHQAEPQLAAARHTPPREEKAKDRSEPLAVPKVKPARTEVKREPPQRVMETEAIRNAQPSQEPKKTSVNPRPVHETSAHSSIEKSKNVPEPSITSPPSKEEDQLDFLLSLRKPVAGEQVMNFAAPTTAVRAAIDEDEPVPHPPPAIPEKKDDDLEDWLDSMLDD